MGGRILAVRNFWNGLLGVVFVAGLTAAGAALRFNASTAGFVFLICVLALAVGRGLVAAVSASLAATLAFNYYFLPPLYTFTVADPANWAALVSFLITAIVGSQLIARARGQAARAEQRQREVQILYDLCFRLFTARPDPGGLREALSQVFPLFDAAGGTLRIERPDTPALEIAADGDPSALPTEATSRRDVAAPILLGAAVRGELALRSTTLSDPVVESAGRLIALAVERERLLEEAAHLEALRQSDALKTALLRAVSHDLRSPLTAMALGLERARREATGMTGLPQTLAAVEVERERLSRRVDNLLTVARLEAGVARPRREPVPAAEILRAAREALHATLDGRTVETAVAADCPDLDVDSSLAVEIVINLLENAARVSAPEQPLTLGARPDEDRGGGMILLEVADRGPGIPSTVLARHGGGAHPGSGEVAAGGLGLEIASSLAQAHGGRLFLRPRPGGGAIVGVSLPAITMVTEEAR